MDDNGEIGTDTGHKNKPINLENVNENGKDTEDRSKPINLENDNENGKDTEDRSKSINLENESENGTDTEDRTKPNSLENNSRNGFISSLTLCEKRVYGLGLMALGGLYIVIANVLVQLMHNYNEEEISPLTVLFCRSIVTTLLAIVFITLGKTNPLPSKQGVLALILLGLSCVSGILFMYLALHKIPVGDVTIIQFTAPIFTSALSVAFLNQPCSKMDVACGFISFFGLFIMTRPTIVFGKEDEDSRELSECITGESHTRYTPDSLEYTYGVIYALTAAILVAVFFVLNKLLGKHGDIILMIFYTGLLGTLLPAVINILTGQSFTYGENWETWLLFLLIGVLSFVHLMFVAESLQFEDAGPASLIRNADSVYAFVLQYAILGVAPRLLTLIGAVIVVTATTTLGVYRYVSARLPKTD